MQGEFAREQKSPLPLSGGNETNKNMGKASDTSRLHSEIERTRQDKSKEDDFKARKQRKELRLMKMSQEWDARRQKRRLDRQKWLEERKTQNLPIWKKVGNLRVQVSDVQGSQIMRHEDDAYSDYTESNLNTVVSFARTDKSVGEEDITKHTAREPIAANNTHLPETGTFSSEGDEKHELAESPKNLSFASVKAEPLDITTVEIKDTDKSVSSLESTADATTESIQELTVDETEVHQNSDQRTPEESIYATAHHNHPEWKQICMQLSDLQRAVPPVVFEEYIKRQGEVKVRTLDNQYLQHNTSREESQNIKSSSVTNRRRSQNSSCFRKDEETSQSFTRVKTCVSTNEKTSSSDSIKMVAPSRKRVSSSSRLSTSLDPVSLTTVHNGGYLMYTRNTNIKFAGKESREQLHYPPKTFSVPNKSSCCTPRCHRTIDLPQTISIKTEPKSVEEISDSIADTEPRFSEEPSEEPKEKRVRYENPDERSPSLDANQRRDEDPSLSSLNRTQPNPGRFISLHKIDGKVTDKTQDSKEKDSSYLVNVRVRSNEGYEGVGSRRAFLTNHKTKIQELAELSVQKHLSNAISSHQGCRRPQQGQRQHRFFAQEHEEQQRRIHRRKEEVQQLKKQKEQHHLQRLRREEQQWKKQQELRQSRGQQEHESKDKTEKKQLHERTALAHSQNCHEEKQNLTISPSSQQQQQREKEQRQPDDGQKDMRSSQLKQTEKDALIQSQKQHKQQAQQQKQLHSSKPQIFDPRTCERPLPEWQQQPFLGGKSTIIVRNIAQPSTMALSQYSPRAVNSTTTSLGVNQTPICSTLSSSNLKQDQSGRFVGPEVMFNPMSLYVRSKLVPREIVIPPRVGSLRTPMVEYIKTDMICKEQLTNWTAKNVADFILATDCSDHANLFLEQEIDGKALLLLTQEMLTKGMSLKLGPAMKLYNHICNLRAALVMNSQST